MELKPIQSYDFGVNLSTLITSLALHFGCIPTIQNGVLICKYVVYHSDEFKKPGEVFLLGLLIVFSNLLCEVTNNMNTFSHNSVVTIVANFVGFYIMIEIKDFYLAQRANFAIKKALTDPLIINKNPARIFGNSVHTMVEEQDKQFDPSREPDSRHHPLLVKTMFYIYRTLRALFCSVYFYFFPLLYLLRPFNELVMTT